MIDTAALQAYLHEHIPLSKAMGVEVLEASAAGVTLAAPLAPNINHRETVFGGSASAVAILAAWSLLYLRLKQEAIEARLVIQQNSMHYERPIAGHFTASCRLDGGNAWRRFADTLRRRDRARIHVSAELHYAGKRAGTLGGDFVALVLR